MIKRNINGKDYYFNPTSFLALEELEKALGYSIYKFISNVQSFSIKEIEQALVIFARYGSTPLTRDTLQTLINDNGINYLVEIVNECIIQILQGQPKGSGESVKKKTKAVS
jgi:hypothetical protein